MTTLEHPAVTVAAKALDDADEGLTPVSIVVRAGLAAVVVDGTRGLYIVFVHEDGGQWTVHGTTYGAPRPAGRREEITPAHMPLQRKGTRFRAETDDPNGPGWFAVIGRAAMDAESLRVVSEQDEHVTEIGDDGLAFALVRARGDESPHIRITTRDGRTIAA